MAKRNGDRRPISSNGFMPEIPRDTRPVSNMKRPLFAEDLNPREDARLQQARNDHTASFTSRAAALRPPLAAATKQRGLSPKERATAVSQLASHDFVSGHLRDFTETRESAAARIADQLTNPDEALRLRGETGVPGASWYVQHNADIHKAIQGTGVPFPHAAVASGSMSPLNSPNNEVRAVGGLARAHGENAKTDITPALAEQIRGVKAAAKHLPDDQVGRMVGFHEMHPAVISAITQIHNPAKGVHVDTGMDTSSIKRAGTNKVNGIRGLRGESNNAVNPPTQAPKVNTYTHNGEVFDSTDHAVADEIDFRAGDAINRRRYHDLAAKPSLTPHEDAALRRLPSPDQYHMDFHGTADDTFTVKPEHHAAFDRFGVPAPEGKVAMRDLHPAQVMALSHPSNPDQHTRRLALLSSQMPTVQDSWANAVIHDQPNVSKGSTNVFKNAGSDQLGYWQTKALKNGTEYRTNVTRDEDGTERRVRSLHDSNMPILDKTRPGVADVKPAALQHAEHDKVTRMAAAHVRDSLQLPYDYPSTIAQAGPWVRVRRNAPGKDPEFEQGRAHEIDSGLRADVSSPPRHPGAPPISGSQFHAPSGNQGRLF